MAEWVVGSSHGLARPSKSLQARTRGVKAAFWWIEGRNRGRRGRRRKEIHLQRTVDLKRTRRSWPLIKADVCSTEAREGLYQPFNQGSCESESHVTTSQTSTSLKRSSGVDHDLNLNLSSCTQILIHDAICLDRVNGSRQIFPAIFNSFFFLKLYSSSCSSRVFGGSIKVYNISPLTQHHDFS